jgi:hypothetical protein
MSPESYSMMADTHPGNLGARGAGSGGGGFGGGLWELGFFEQFRYYPYYQMMPAAPAALPSGGVPALPAAPAAGFAPAKGGPQLKRGIAPKRYGVVPEITITDATAEKALSLHTTLGAASDTPALARARDPVALGGSVARSKIQAETEALSSAARSYTELRARMVGEQMTGVLAHQLRVPVDSVKAALDHLKRSDGWNPRVVGQAAGEPVADDAVRAILRIEQSVTSHAPLVVREYAAPLPGADSDIDSPDTDLWQPVIVLPADGKAKLTLPLGNAAGGYQVVIAGHTLDGRLGAVRGIIPVAPVQPTESSRPAALPGQAPPVPPPAP